MEKDFKTFFLEWRNVQDVCLVAKDPIEENLSFIIIQSKFNNDYQLSSIKNGHKNHIEFCSSIKYLAWNCVSRRLEQINESAFKNCYVIPAEKKQIFLDFIDKL